MADPAITQNSIIRKLGTRPRTGKSVRCDACGRLHYRKRHRLDQIPGGGRLYCSRACQYAVSARLNLVCDTCGTTYGKFRSQVHIGKNKFCSRECRAQFGLSRVSCCWPGCIETLPCRLTRGTARGGADEYKVNLVKKGHYTKYAFCPSHAGTLRKYLGEKTRFTLGRSRLLADPDREYGGRALSSRFTRMVVFERAGCKCQSCLKTLDWRAPPKTWQVDHVVPVFKGGKTKLDNLQILCRGCHDEKSAPEKSEASRERHSLTRANRWLTHHQKDLLIERLRARLKALGEPTD